MEDDEGWKKRVEVNIEAIAPLDIFSKTARWLDQVFIAHHLQQRKDHKHRQLTITNLNRRHIYFSCIIMSLRFRLGWDIFYVWYKAGIGLASRLVLSFL